MTDKTIATAIPPGYRRDAQGRLVDEQSIRALDLLRDDLVQRLIGRGMDMRQALRRYKEDTFSEIAAFVEMSAAEYGVHLGGEKGNITLTSFDGRYRIQRAVAEHIRFDERLLAAKGLIDECLQDWTQHAGPELRTLVADAFRVDGSGNIRTGSVLALRRLDIADERWQKAMQAIAEAVHVIGSKSYIRLYERNAHGAYEPISLDIAGV